MAKRKSKGNRNGVGFLPLGRTSNSIAIGAIGAPIGAHNSNFQNRGANFAPLAYQGLGCSLPSDFSASDMPPTQKCFSLEGTPLAKRKCTSWGKGRPQQQAWPSESAADGGWEGDAFTQDYVVDIDDTEPKHIMSELNSDMCDEDFRQRAPPLTVDVHEVRVAEVEDLVQEVVEEDIEVDKRHAPYRTHEEYSTEDAGIEASASQGSQFQAEYREKQTMTAARLAECEALLISKEVTYHQALLHQQEQNNMSLAASIDALQFTKAETEQRLEDQARWREELKATQQQLEESCAKQVLKMDELEMDRSRLLGNINRSRAHKAEMDQQIEVASRHVNEMALQEQMLRNAEAAKSDMYNSLEVKRARLDEGLKSLLADGIDDDEQTEQTALESRLMREVHALMEQLPLTTVHQASRLEELVPRIGTCAARVAELKNTDAQETGLVKAKEAERHQLEQRVRVLEDSVSEKRAQLEGCVRTSRTLVAKLTRLTATAEECQRSVEESKSLCERVALQSKAAEEDIREHRLTLAHYEKMTEDLVKRRDGMKEEQANRDIQIRHVLQRSQDLLKQIDAAETNSADQSMRLKDLNDQISQITYQIRHMELSRAAKAEQMASLEAKHTEVSQELETCEEHVRQQDERLRANAELHESLDQQLRQARSERSAGELRLTESQVSVGRLMADLDILQKRLQNHEMQSLLSGEQVAKFEHRLSLLQRAQEVWELRASIYPDVGGCAGVEDEVGAFVLSPDVDAGSCLGPCDVAQHKSLPSAYRTLSDYVASFTALLHNRVASSLCASSNRSGVDSLWKASPYIMCGGSSVSAAELKKFGVGAVVNLAPGTSEQARYVKDGAEFPSLWVPMVDSLSYDVCGKFKEVHEFIKEQEDRQVLTYVHCCKGVNRSPTMVVSYLTWRARQADTNSQRLPLELLLESWERVAKACGQAYPLNPWFRKQMVLWALNSFDCKRLVADPAWGPSMFRSRAEYMLRKKFHESHWRSRDAFASELVYAEGKHPDAFDMGTPEAVARAVERIQSYVSQRLQKRVAAESSTARSPQPSASQAAEIGWSVGVLKNRTQISID